VRSAGRMGVIKIKKQKFFFVSKIFEYILYMHILIYKYKQLIDYKLIKIK